MSNKKCPQCKNLISADAPTCLFCGRPNKFVTKDYINKKWNKNKTKQQFNYIPNSIYLILLVIIFVIFIIIIFN